MHPANSVIVFTTASGAGYGLLFWLGFFSVIGWLPAESVFALISLALALGLISGGLLSSTLHLGHPERAWRAINQWRSSWLSREGVVAIAAYAPASIFALGWIFLGSNQGVFAAAGLLASVLALVTVYCTAMIYASLRTIAAWNNPWTPPAYMVLALMTGAVLLYALARLFSLSHAFEFGTLAALLIFVACIVKLGYWRLIDTSSSISDTQSATGLGFLGKVSLLDAPHTQDNYLMKEMGYRIARKHSAKLRRIALIAGFAAPFITTLVSMTTVGMSAMVFAISGAILCAIGIFTERWLFFAEAKHAVTLYYGAAKA